MPSNISDISPDSDSPSFTELVTAHQSMLHGYIRSMIPDPHLAKDVLQETNMTLLRKADDFQPGTSFGAWSRRVAFFEVLGSRRRAGRDRLVFSENLLDQIGETFERRSAEEEARRKALTVCLGKLPERQREMIQWRFLDGDDVAVIAERCALKANAVSQVLFRAKRNLARCLSRGMAAAAAPAPRDADRAAGPASDDAPESLSDRPEEPPSA